MIFDPAEFGKGLARSVKALISERLQPLESRIIGLESRAPLPGPQGEKGEAGQAGPQGERGRDADMGEIKSHIDVAVLATVKDCFDKTADSLRGEKGDPGIAGEPGQIGPRGPQGDRGADGEAGAQGVKGEPGKDAQPVDVRALTVELANSPEIKTVVDLLVAEGIAEYFKANPVKDGKDGANGEQGPQGIPGEKGETGEQGSDGASGKDGRDGTNGISPTAESVAEIVLRTIAAESAQRLSDIETDYAKRLADYERRFHESMSKAIEAMPKPRDGRDGDKGEPGKDGRDGKSFEYRGVFKDGETYLANTMVTSGGCCWCAKRDTGDKPGTSDAWVLAVKKGRDAKEPAKL